MLSWSAVSGATSYTVKRSQHHRRSLHRRADGHPQHQLHQHGADQRHDLLLRRDGHRPRRRELTRTGPDRHARRRAPCWQTKDIGTVGLAGTYSESAGTHTVRGAGADMYGTADAFRFAYQTITGDVTITARVTGLALHSGGGTINVMGQGRGHDPGGQRHPGRPQRGRPDLADRHQPVPPPAAGHRRREHLEHQSPHASTSHSRVAPAGACRQQLPQLPRGEQHRPLDRGRSRRRRSP